MNKGALQKIISVVLALGLFLTSVYVPVSDTYAETVSEWESLADIDDAALSEKSVAVTMTTREGRYMRCLRQPPHLLRQLSSPRPEEN